MSNEHRIRVNVKMIFRCGDEAMYYLVERIGVRDFPGGGVEYGETLIDALKRELKEEIGYDLVETPRQAGIVDYVPDDTSVHHIIIGFTIALPSKPTFTFHHDNDEHPEDVITFHWVHKDDIDRKPFCPNHKTLLRNAFDVQS